MRAVEGTRLIALDGTWYFSSQSQNIHCPNCSSQRHADGRVTHFHSAATATAGTRQPFSYSITATDEPTSFAASNLPAGLSLNSTTDVISSAPDLAGTYTIRLSASNGEGTGIQTLTLTLAPLTLTIKFIRRDGYKLIFNGDKNQVAVL